MFVYLYLISYRTVYEHHIKKQYSKIPLMIGIESIVQLCITLVRVHGRNLPVF